jgi:hypothetical protein
MPYFQSLTAKQKISAGGPVLFLLGGSRLSGYVDTGYNHDLYRSANLVIWIADVLDSGIRGEDGAGQLVDDEGRAHLQVVDVVGGRGIGGREDGSLARLRHAGGKAESGGEADAYEIGRERDALDGKGRS